MDKNLAPSRGKFNAERCTGAKGWNFVSFLGRSDSRSYPAKWLLEEKEKDPNELEEYLNQQRSLLYVALTRAREKAYITSFGSLSEFVT